MSIWLKFIRQRKIKFFYFPKGPMRAKKPKRWEKLTRPKEEVFEGLMTYTTTHVFGKGKLKKNDAEISLDQNNLTYLHTNRVRYLFEATDQKIQFYETLKVWRPTYNTNRKNRKTFIFFQLPNGLLIFLSNDIFLF